MPTEQQQIPPKRNIPRGTNGGTPLKNPRHEMFALARAQGMTADAAYEMAGYAENRSNAARLNANEHVRQRITQLQADIARRATTATAIDKTYVLRQAVSLHTAAMASAMAEDGGFDVQAANVASRTLGQIGDHVDVQAWKQAQDINVHVTVDAAIARLAQLDPPAIEGDYEVIDASDN